MIQHGILEMDSIYDMLGPEDKTILADSDKELSEAKEFVRRVNVVSTLNKESSNANNKDGSEKNSMDSSVDQMNALNATNPKFGLLEALLKVGAWTEAAAVMARLPTYYAVSQPMIASALQTLIHTTMDPIHRK